MILAFFMISNKQALSLMFYIFHKFDLPDVFLHNFAQLYQKGLIFMVLKQKLVL